MSSVVILNMVSSVVSGAGVLVNVVSDDTEHGE